MTMASPLNVQPELPNPAEMTDREIAEETLLWLRSFGAAMQQFQSGGMAAMMKGLFTAGRKG